MSGRLTWVEMESAEGQAAWKALRLCYPGSWGNGADLCGCDACAATVGGGPGAGAPWACFSEYNKRAGETWQYMGTKEEESGRWVHEFRHRARPWTGQRVYQHVRASAGWTPEPEAVRTMPPYGWQSVDTTPEDQQTPCLICGAPIDDKRNLGHDPGCTAMRWIDGSLTNPRQP